MKINRGPQSSDDFSLFVELHGISSPRNRKISIYKPTPYLRMGSQDTAQGQKRHDPNQNTNLSSGISRAVKCCEFWVWSYGQIMLYSTHLLFHIHTTYFVHTMLSHLNIEKKWKLTILNLFHLSPQNATKRASTPLKTIRAVLHQPCLFIWNERRHPTTSSLAAWRIIPVSKWLITIVSKSPKWGYSPYKWPFDGL